MKDELKKSNQMIYKGFWNVWLFLKGKQMIM